MAFSPIPVAAPLPGWRDPAPLLARTLRQWRGQHDLWLFAYGSLIWRPEFAAREQRIARVYGWHRALKMWSRVNRGSPDCPGLVLSLLPGGSCRGMAFCIARAQGQSVLEQLWQREMVNGVYEPRWLLCHTPQGPVRALAFTLSRRSASHTGVLTDAQYRQIFATAHGRYGSTLDYARPTYEELARLGIDYQALGRLLALAGSR